MKLAISRGKLVQISTITKKVEEELLGYIPVDIVKVDMENQYTVTKFITGAPLMFRINKILQKP